MKPHFSMVISANQRMEYQTELFVRSLERFGNCSDYFFDLFILENETIRSPFLRRKVDIRTYKLESKFLYPWSASPRWNFEPKSDICIQVDCDMMVLNDISKITNFCQNKGFYACIANIPPFQFSDWEFLFDLFGVACPEKMYLYKKTCGNFQGDKNESVCPFYPNCGLLVVHKEYHEKIRQVLPEILDKFNETKYRDSIYFAQITTALVLLKEKIPSYLLPNGFNYIANFNYNKPLYFSDEGVVICHYNHKISNDQEFKSCKLAHEALQKLREIKLL